MSINKMTVYTLEYEHLNMNMRYTVDVFATEELAKEWCRIQDTIEKKKKRTPINESRNGYFGGMYLIKGRDVKTEIKLLANAGTWA